MPLNASRLSPKNLITATTRRKTFHQYSLTSEVCFLKAESIAPFPLILCISVSMLDIWTGLLSCSEMRCGCFQSHKTPTNAFFVALKSLQAKQNTCPVDGEYTNHPRGASCPLGSRLHIMSLVDEQTRPPRP